MRPRFFAITTAAALAAFAAGVWCAPWLRNHKGAPTAGHRSEAPPPPAPLTGGAGQGGSIIIDPTQSKADARLAAESPQAFLDSLSGESGLKAQARIAAALAEMPLTAVRELTGKIDALRQGNGQKQWQLSAAVFERWSELDADGLLAEARLSDYGMISHTGLQAALRQLARRDPVGTWEKTRDMGGQTYRAKQAVLTAIGEQDPQAALRLIMQDPTSQRDGWVAGSFMQAWFMRDREAAMTALGNIPNGEFRASLVGQIGSAFAASDPEGALAWGKTLKNPPERTGVLYNVLEVMTDRNPQKTLALLDDPAFASMRRNGLETVASTWAKRDFDAALAHALVSTSPADQLAMLRGVSYGSTYAQRLQLLEVAAKLPPSASRPIYETALEAARDGAGLSITELLNQVKSPSLREELLKNQVNYWGQSPDETKAFFAELQPTSQTTRQASHIASRLAWSDPADAVAWARGLASEDLKNEALKSALRTWAQNDPKAAAAQIHLLPNTSQRTETLRSIAQTWAGNDESGALAWAQSLGGADRSAALGALVQNSLNASPDKARELYASFAASLDAESAAKTENRGVARSVAATLTESAPQEAIAWASTLAPGGAQDEAIGDIAEKWAGYDPVAASEWIGSLPAGEGRDMAAEKLASSIARDDPESAWAWAASIQDAAKRRAAASTVLQAWKGYGHLDEARAALNAAGFSADDAKELAKVLQ